MEPAIRIRGLSKSYMIGHESHHRYLTLRDEMAAAFRRLTGRAAASAEQRLEEFWALRDVTLDLHPGDRLGIIGRNGAGKSTLLKVLSRITEPTAGRVEIRGRVASLLEVGTGFHPELTGRENIFLSGAILGMTRAEIRARFDEIVAFAEVERFVDTPVKHYSSGMYVRLAFAVAAHLECDILIVDEVLSVGDAVFQKRCIGKLEGMSGTGRTVLFVSHNLEALQRLCNCAVFLERGRVQVFDRDVAHVIGSYFSHLQQGESETEWRANGKQFDNRWFAPSRVALTDGEGQPLTQPARNNGEMWVQIEGDVTVPDTALQVGYSISDETGAVIYWSAHTDGPDGTWPAVAEGRNVLRARIPEHLLNEGAYRIELLVCLYWGLWILRPGVNSPTIHLEIQGGLSQSSQWVQRRPGFAAPIVEWRRV